MPSTVLVICYKYKTLDKKKLTKVLVKTAWFESKKLYENQVGLDKTHISK
jgi:DNA polymerase-3 subunit delta